MIYGTHYGQTNLPYNESFTSGTIPAGITLPSAANGSRVNATVFTNMGALLTQDTATQFGSLLLQNYAFSNANGVQIEFEYEMSGGTPNNPADGISVFLYDANETGSIGHWGRGLGYTYNRTTSAYRTYGVKGAYLMVGFDQFANSRARGGSGNEVVQGMSATFGERSMVVIRGGFNKSGITDDEKYFYGYPLLAVQSTIYKQTPGSSSYAGGRLDYVNGNYTFDNYNIPDATFSLRGGKSFQSENDIGYRKAYVILKPMSSGGFYITVKVKGNDNGTVFTRTIYDNLPYPTSLNFPENAQIIPTGSDPNSYNVKNLDSSPPDLFKIGFAATTGTFNQKHLIKNLTVSLPYMPDTVDDQAKYCHASALTEYVEINPFLNDILFKGSIADDLTPLGGNSNLHIDFDSFRFQNGEIILAPNTTNSFNGNLLELTTSEGVWAYNKVNGKVQFKPKRNFVGIASIEYTVKGFGNSAVDGPFGQELYRSSPRSISIEVFECGGSSNPAIQSGSYKKH